MAFEVVARGEFRATEPLAEGECSVGVDGRVCLRVADLATVNIAERALILVDGGSLRLAFRRPREGEEAAAHLVSTAKQKPGGGPAQRCSVLATRAIRRLGLEPRAVAGRYELTCKDDLLILDLAGERISAREIERLGRARPEENAKHARKPRG